MSEGRILYIDAYDSFANNIIALLKAELSVSVESVKIDDSRFVLNDDAFHEFLAGFDALDIRVHLRMLDRLDSCGAYRTIT